MFHLSSAELAYSPTALCFSKDGRRLLVGFEDGSITSYLLEQQDDESFQQRVWGTTAFSFPKQPITFIQNIILERDEKEKELCRRRYLYSLDSRIFTGEEEDERDLLPHLATASSLSFSSFSSVIITLNQANVLQIFSANLFPLLALSFPEFYRSIRFIGMEKSNILCESIGSDAHILLSTPLTALSKLPTLNSITALLLSIGTDLKELRNIVAGNLRKWKDALKPIIPKIMLMQSTLAGYDLRLDPIAFYFSVAMAGLWHPAAKVVFSSQWNEQNLNRLRASVEGAGRSLLHSLVITCARIATNINLKCRDLLLLAADVKGVNDLPSHLLPQLILYANQLLFKLDDTIQEAKLALERMLLFLQVLQIH